MRGAGKELSPALVPQYLSHFSHQFPMHCRPSASLPWGFTGPSVPQFCALTCPGWGTKPRPPLWSPEPCSVHRAERGEGSPDPGGRDSKLLCWQLWTNVRFIITGQVCWGLPPYHPPSPGSLYHPELEFTLQIRLSGTLEWVSWQHGRCLLGADLTMGSRNLCRR